MGKISGYGALAITKRADLFLGVSNQGSTPKTVRVAEDTLSRAVGSIGFVGNTTNSGSPGTTYAVVDTWSTAIHEKGFSTTPSNDFIEVPTGEGGTFYVEVDLNVMASVADSIVKIRLTKNGAAVAGTEHECCVPGAARPTHCAIRFPIELVQADRLRVEAAFSGSGGSATGGTITYTSGTFRVGKVRSAV